MEIGQTAPTTSSATLAQPKAEVSSDFETFLKMLTVQMKNQDPLNPVDSSDYAVQLATFSGVEQAVQTNDLLRTLTAQMSTSGMAEMAAWVGKEARAAAPAYFNGNPITIAPDPAVTADKAEVVVRDKDGTEVQRFEIPVSAEPIEWAGVADGGYPFAEGLYSFDVVSSANGEVLMQEQSEIYSTVKEVRVQGVETILILQGGAAVSSNQVSALRDPTL